LNEPRVKFSHPGVALQPPKLTIGVVGRNETDAQKSKIVHRGCQADVSFVDCIEAIRYSSMFSACNAILDLAMSDLVMFVHNDVELREPIGAFLGKTFDLFESDPRIAVAGVIGGRNFGVGSWWLGGPANSYGQVYQWVNLVRYQDDGGYVNGCVDVQGVDGLLLVVRKSAGLRFDEETFDGWHFYDIDLCFQALEKGYRVVAYDALVQHNSGGVQDEGYRKSLAYMREKWIGAGRRK